MLSHPNVRYATPSASGNLNSGALPTLASAKVHLRVDFNDDDDYITAILSSVESYIQDYCGVTFGSTVTHVAYWDHAYPVVNVHWNGDSIKSTGAGNAPVLAQLVDGTYVDMEDADYDLDLVSSPIRVHMKSASSHVEVLNQYRLTFKTQTQTVPEYVYQAALMIIGHYYENRQDVGKERIFEVPMNSRYLLDRYRKQAFT